MSISPERIENAWKWFLEHYTTAPTGQCIGFMLEADDEFRATHPDPTCKQSLPVDDKEPALPKGVWMATPINGGECYCYSASNCDSVVFMDDSWPIEAIDAVIKHKYWRSRQRSKPAPVEVTDDPAYLAAISVLKQSELSELDQYKIACAIECAITAALSTMNATKETAT